MSNDYLKGINFHADQNTLDHSLGNFMLKAVWNVACWSQPTLHTYRSFFAK